MAVMIWRVMALIFDQMAGELDAQLGKGPERRLVLGPEVASGLVEPDQRLLLDVVGVGAHQEVAAGLGPGEAPVAGDHQPQAVLAAVLEAGDQLQVGQVGEVVAGLHRDGSL
jgi:hypothetical protein